MVWWEGHKMGEGEGKWCGGKGIGWVGRKCSVVKCLQIKG